MKLTTTAVHLIPCNPGQRTNITIAKFVQEIAVRDAYWNSEMNQYISTLFSEPD